MSSAGPGWKRVAACLAVGLLCGACGGRPGGPSAGSAAQPRGMLRLPPVAPSGPISLEEALASRRSMREFTAEPLTMETIGQLLWAAQGVTEAGGRGRTAPSAGGTYPLELYLVGIGGVFHYLPEVHSLEILGEDDRRAPLAEAALGQSWVATAPAVFVVVVVVSRTAERYGDRAERYVALEAGHAAQNLLLQATARGLGAVPVGAFSDAGVRALLGLPPDWTPLYLIPVGHPAGG